MARSPNPSCCVRCPRARSTWRRCARGGSDQVKMLARRVRARHRRAKRWPRSDHFDGERFFNPTMTGSPPSLRSVYRMTREPRSRWPVWVENKGVPRLKEQLAPADVAITFVNHVTFVIQTGGLTILTDPVWSERASPFTRVGPKRVR